ncbi:MAG: hypothetical protein GY943_10000 [Chloroflexi bacterium]|nr:hypothetical protein [Chloroflexota bacterium]
MQNSVNGFQKSKLNELRLVAKSVGFLALLTGLLYLRVAVDEGMLAPQEDGIAINIWLLMALFVIGTLGLLSAWRWEAVGGVTAVLSGIGLLILFLSMGRGWLNAIFYGSPFMISGALFVGCWWRNK